MFKIFKPKKKTNYQLLYWSLYIGTVVALSSKILELSSELSLKIIADNPQLTEYSAVVKLYLIFS